MHFYHRTVSWQVAGILFINFGLKSIHLRLFRNLPLLEQGSTQTISLGIFLGNIFVHTGFLKNDFVILGACKKLHLLGRQASIVCLNDDKTGQRKIWSIKPWELFSVLKNYTICQMANDMENLTGYF